MRGYLLASNCNIVAAGTYAPITLFLQLAVAMKPHLILVLLLTLSSLLNAEERNPWNSHAVKNEYLRHELLDMRQVERKASLEFFEGMKNAGISLDDGEWTIAQILVVGLHALRDNCVKIQLSYRLEEIINEFGWPSVSLVGTDGVAAAVRIVEIADHNRDFQKRCLTLMKEESQKGEVCLKKIAKLTDVILVSEGNKQRYGTQFGAGMVLEPVENVDALDARREAMGLPTLAKKFDLLKQEAIVLEDKTGYNSDWFFQKRNSD